MTRWIGRLRRAPWLHLAGWLSLLTSLMVVAGCATAAGTSSSALPPMPVLQAPPLKVPCRINGQPADCTALLSSDYVAIVTTAKAYCLALGKSPAECATDVP